MVISPQFLPLPSLMLNLYDAMGESEFELDENDERCFYLENKFTTLFCWLIHIFFNRFAFFSLFVVCLLPFVSAQA